MPERVDTAREEEEEEEDLRNTSIRLLLTVCHAATLGRRDG